MKIIIIIFQIFITIFIFLLIIHIYLGNIFIKDNEEEWAQIRMRTESNRKFSQTKEEMELTKAVPIIDAQPCNDVHPISVFIHSAGRSNGKYLQRRDNLRNTWVSEMKKRTISLYFVMALNINQTVNEELREESDKYQDIIQFAFIDGYFNLTLKAISLLRWIDRKCQKSTHILKVDDDVIVNTPYLLDNLSHLKPGFSGYLWNKLHVFRDPKNKWYLPEKYHSNDVYPDFITGGAYIMAQNITPSLLKTIDSYSGYVLLFDDVFITGVVPEKTGIPRYNETRIKFVTRWRPNEGCADVCQLFDAFVVFQCLNANQILEVWSKWKNSTSDQCSGKQRPMASMLTITLVLLLLFSEFII